MYGISDFESFDQKPTASTVTMSQGLRIMECMGKVNNDKREEIIKHRNSIIEMGKNLSVEAGNLAEINHSMYNEVKAATKLNPFSSIESQEKDSSQFKSVVTGKHFIKIAYDIVLSFSKAYTNLVYICSDLIPDETIASVKSSSAISNTNDIKDKIFEYQLNEGAIKKYASAILKLEACHEMFLSDIAELTATIENYFRYLTERHKTQGFKVHRDALITDIAYAIFENVDAHGEIANGTLKDELSAYTLNKGLLVVEAASNPIVAQLISEPDLLIKYIKSGINTIGGIINEVKSTMGNQVDEVLETIGITKYMRASEGNVMKEYNLTYSKLLDINPASIISKLDEKFITQDEKFSRDFEEETIQTIVEKLSAKTPPGEVLKFILSRKVALKKHYLEENTFYVCQISQGNPFLGEAPGALKVIPGKKPGVGMNHIVGSGFDSVREFYQSVESGAKWQPLFIATSPSRSADKSNCLMVGPPGCIAGDSLIKFDTRDKGTGERVSHKTLSIEKLWKRFHNNKSYPSPKQKNNVDYFVSSITHEGLITKTKIKDIVLTGEKECFLVKTSTGEEIKATADHKFLTDTGYVELSNLKIGSSVNIHKNYIPKKEEIKSRNNIRKYIYVKNHPICGTKIVDGRYKYKRLARSRAVMEARLSSLDIDTYIDKLNSNDLDNLNFISRDMHVHHKDENILNYDIENLVLIHGPDHNREHSDGSINYHTVSDTIVSVRSVGVLKTYDIKVNSVFHNYVANDFCIHNCGKTELMRAIGGHKDCIGIFAQGSDFLTCWKGEAEKNPKRLFEQALKLHKESKKRVYILIDEVDSVMHKPEGHNDINLTLEFQILMDGVVSYPGISVWGATNHPDRIPMAMIRRFNKVEVVGELDSDCRVQLLKQFLGYLPQKDFNDDSWKSAASKLDGATGDVIRQVCDHIWRKKMHTFVSKNKEGASEIMDFLTEKEGGFDISTFNDKDIYNFKGKLQKYVNVTPSDVTDSINVHLRNMAVQSEIETAVTTYKAARQFLHTIDADLS